MRGRGRRWRLGGAAVALGIALGGAMVPASSSALVAGIDQVTPRAALPAATRAVITNRDWGADALTDTLYFHWHTSRDAALVPYLRAHHPRAIT